MQYGSGSAMQVGMQIEIILAQVALHQQLVLLRISASDHQIVLAGQEPIEFFKPSWLPHLLYCCSCLDLQTTNALNG